MIETNGFQILNPDILKVLERKDSSCTNNMHAQRDVQKHCFVYPRTTLREALSCDILIFQKLSMCWGSPHLNSVCGVRVGEYWW